MDAVKIFRKRK
jgi:hypothetical protein